MPEHRPAGALIAEARDLLCYIRFGLTGKLVDSL